MRLLIFTQKVDKNDSNLGFFHLWLLEFAKNCESIKVICLYEGEHSLPKNVEVLSLGKEKGVSSFISMLRVYKHIFTLRGSYDRVFVHMNPVYLVLCGLYFKIKKIPVYMWYVHRSVDLKLRIATFFSKKIFTSAKESFRIETPKVIYVGHGINMDALPNTLHLYKGGTLNVVHIGRITAIKNIEIAILTLDELKKKDINPQLTFYGEGISPNDIEYRIKLEKIIEEKDLAGNVTFAGGIVYADLAARLTKTHVTVNMTPPGGMDKVVLESLLLGVPAFMSNTAFTGVLGEYKELFLYEFGSEVMLADKIYNFLHTSNSQSILQILNSRIRKDFGLPNLIEKIIITMK